MGYQRSVAEHRDAVSALLKDWGGRTERAPLRQALGRCVVGDVASPIALPGFDNSQMDGYAVRATELAAATEIEPVSLSVGETIPAGRTDTPPLPPGTAMPIMTGAPIPAGADAVVPVEAATPDCFLTERPAQVSFRAPARSGAFVRRQGSDVTSGHLLVFAGQRLGPRQLGLLAAAGVAEVTVRPRPSVLLLSTGSELRQPGEPLETGQIYDANTTLLVAALSEDGAEVTTARVASDSAGEFADLLCAQLQQAAKPFDLIVTSGGVSAGAFEVVKDAMRSEDVEFVSVTMQPGGPQGIGRVAGIPLLAFPGNPVSAFISYEVFLRPVLRAAAGYPDAARTSVSARLCEPLTSSVTMHQLRRGTLRAAHSGGHVVELDSGPGSHLVGALASANALVHIPVGTAQLPPGAPVEVWQLGEPLPPRESEAVDSANLTHLNRRGEAHMVDVSGKAPSKREATARASVHTTVEVIAKLEAADLKKGDALGVARVAGIMAAKRTAELVPLCHPLPLTSVSVELVPGHDSVEITATVATTGVTGVEMEALTAASVAGLTVYDMIKALDPAASIEQVAVWRKTGGKTGEWTRP